MWRGLTSAAVGAALAVALPVGASAAVGSPAASPDASAWTVQATVLPAGATSGTLSSVSCPSKTNCIALGTYNTRLHSSRPLAERWNGSTWTLISGGLHPAPNGGFQLVAISCVSASSCTAVGHYTSAGTEVPLAEHWNGSRWAVRATPSPAGVTASELTAVSCTSDNSCVAAGGATDSGLQQPLAESWNGTSWTIQATPNPGVGDGSALTAVSCTAATSCTAIGEYVPNEQEQPFAEYWNGSDWAIQAMPTPSEDDPTGMPALSCVSATSCIAVGEYYNSGEGTEYALAEDWNGSTWTQHNVYGALSGYLDGISCVSATSCTAVGYHDFSNKPYMAFAVRWNGSAWRPEQTAQPNTGQQLFAISCVNASACTAVGNSTTGPQPLAEGR